MMKNFRVLLSCFVVLSLILTGCSNNKIAPSDSSQTTAESAPIFDVSIYDEIITKVKDVIALAGAGEAPEGMEGIHEFASIYAEEAFELLCYQYQDLNGDNIPELLIGVSVNQPDTYARNQIYLAYTVVDQVPTQILASNYRNSYSLFSDGTFGQFGSAGALYSIFGEYSLSQDNKLVCTDYYFTHEIDGDFENIGVFHNQTGNFDVASSNQDAMTPDEFYEYQEEQARRILPLSDAKPLSGFQQAK